MDEDEFINILQDASKINKIVKTVDICAEKTMVDTREGCFTSFYQ